MKSIIKHIIVITGLSLSSCISEPTELYEKAIFNTTTEKIKIISFKKYYIDTLFSEIKPKSKHVLKYEVGESGGVGIEMLDSTHYLSSDSILAFIGDSIVTFYGNNTLGKNTKAILSTDKRSYYGSGWVVTKTNATKKEGKETFVYYTF